MNFTTYIAIYAAILSTTIFVWNVKNSRPNIKVELVFGSDGEGNDFKFGIFIGLKNLSSHEAHINHVSLLYPFREVSVFEDLKWILTYRRLRPYRHWVHASLPLDKLNTKLPVTIAPFTTHTIFIPESTLDEILTDNISNKFAAIAQDALWRTKYSHPIKRHLTK